MKLPVDYRKGKKLERLVENQTTYTVANAEMHIFETHQQAEQVLLRFDQPVLASMVQGKKVMHLRDLDPFAFLPGESVMLPARELMCIDFPEASRAIPTKCLAMAIDDSTILQVAQLLNETRPKADEAHWTLSDCNCHFTNEAAVSQLIHRLIFLFTEDHPEKELFVDMTMRELIIRMLQAESRQQHLKAASKTAATRFAHVIRYIRTHLHQKLSVRELSKEACMSESHFFRKFKTELGQSPVDFVNEERLQLAKRLLANPARPLNDIYLACGFNSHSYFSRMFKRRFGWSPAAYRQEHTLTRTD